MGRADLVEGNTSQLTSILGFFHSIALAVIHLKLLVIDEELTSRNLARCDVSVWVLTLSRKLVGVFVSEFPDSFE